MLSQKNLFKNQWLLLYYICEVSKFFFSLILIEIYEVKKFKNQNKLMLVYVEKKVFVNCFYKDMCIYLIVLIDDKTYYVVLFALVF